VALILNNKKYNSAEIAQIRKFINSPIPSSQLASKFEIPIRLEASKDEILEAQAFQQQDIMVISNNLLNHVFGGLSANPNREPIVAQMDSIFSKNAYPNNGGTQGYEEIKADILQHILDYKYLAVIGERGSGKTLFLNKVLIDETKSFFDKEARVTWSRIEVTKLYDLRDDKRSDFKAVDFANYFKIHSAYVYLEYSDQLRNPHSFNHSACSILKEICKYLNDNKSSGEFNAYFSALATIKGFYQRLQKSTGEIKLFPSEQVLRIIFRSGNENIRKAFYEIYDTIQRCMTILDIGFLAIIDGIDNVSWSHSDDRYIQMRDDAIQFIRTFSDLVDASRRSLMVICRPETVPELNIELLSYDPGEAQLPTEIPRFKRWNIAKPEPISVITKKLYAAKTAPAFKAKREKTVESVSRVREINQRKSIRTLNTVLKNYKNDNNNIIGNFVSEVNSLISNVKPDPYGFFQTELKQENFLPDIFNDNLRALIHAFRRSKEGKNIQVKQGVVGTSSPKRVPEFLLLGGNMYLDSTPLSASKTRYSEINMGEVFPNIFWYNPTASAGYNSVWHGLSGLRLLQLINFVQLPAGDYLYLLHHLFGYSPTVLCEQLEAFVAFGLVDINLQEPATKPIYAIETNSIFSTYKGFMNVTKKGKILSTLSFFYLDYMYFCALDTPLHYSYLKDVSGEKYVRFYIDPVKSNEDSRRFDFKEAKCVTIPTFTRHLIHYSDLKNIAFNLRPDLNAEGKTKIYDPEFVKIIENIFKNGDDSAEEYLQRVFYLPENWSEYSLNEIAYDLESFEDRLPEMYNDYKKLVDMNTISDEIF